ncbi:MAG: branched-chain amino acid aminotransferase [Lentisphaeria bacterium]|nr:branched-chain amino acid aminotransferase [Lentisphaeria bacterium]
MSLTAKQNLDWENLGFSHRDTHCHIRYTFKDGQWDAGQLVKDPHISVHIAATALHYGQAAFEGLKVFERRDGSLAAFRPGDNAQRLEDTAKRVCMAPVPKDMFVDGITRVVQANADFVPPYGTGGALYVRPLLFGSGPRIGIQPAAEYTFIILVLPVGNYYKGGLQPVRAVILDNYDRAAPQGVGHVKVAGNYAASLEPHHVAAEMGFPIELYLDAKEHRYVDEFGTSNFVAITHDNTFVTAKSHSVLPSITNRSLQTIARDMGMAVEIRPIEYSEIGHFAEVAACGTAVVITPVNEIVRGDETIRVGPADGCGPVFQKLYDQVRAIQQGDVDDTHDWMTPVPLD